MAKGKRAAAVPLAIGLIAVACSLWAVVDFVAAARPEALPAVSLPDPATEHSVASRPIDLHRLLPAAPEDIGALVRVDGTVIGAADGKGFWVRDLRDNVVRVQSGERPAAGAAVRVVGRLARLAAVSEPAAGTLPGDRVLTGLEVVASGPDAIETPGG